MTEPIFNNLLIIPLYRWLFNTCTRNNCISCDICEITIDGYSDDEITVGGDINN